MKKQLFVLLCCVLSMTATMAQSTNSNDDLLKQGVSNRQAKKEAQNKQDRQLYWLGKVPVKDGKGGWTHWLPVPTMRKCRR